MTGRSHARISLAIWTDSAWRALPVDAQWMYLALLSQPNITQAGVVAMTTRRWASLAEGLEPHAVERALKTLESRRFVVVDEATEEVLVRTFIRNDGVVQQPNVLKNALTATLTVQSPALRKALATELRRVDPTSLKRVPAGHEPLDSVLARTLRELDPITPSEGYGEGYVEPSPEPFAEPFIGDGDGDGELPPVGSNSTSSAEADAGEKRSEPRREDVEQLCRLLRDRIVDNGGKPPTIGETWRKAARLMLDRDARDLTQALALIEWCQADEFWRSNILSMPKFREKYDQLRLRAPDVAPARPRLDPADQLRQWWRTGDTGPVADLVRRPWIEPSQHPDDRTPRESWLLLRRREFIETHHDAALAALIARSSE